MDVIGAGFGRTGTLSLKAALEQLGLGPCMHMLPLLSDPPRAGLFHKAALGDRASLRAALGDSRSSVDWPGAFFWRELMEEYPQAKVLLTVRDPQRWYDSMEQTIVKAASMPQPPAGVPAAAGVEMIRATVMDGTFHGRVAERDYAIQVFNDHVAEVKATVPADRLLVFEVAEGWEPLCEFLGKPVPEQPFPRLNDTAEFQARLGRRHP